MHRCFPLADRARTRNLLFGLIGVLILGAANPDLIEQAKSRLAKSDAKGAVALLEAALPKTKPSDRPPLLKQLRVAYQAAWKQAKDAGRDAVAVFDQSMRKRVTERLELERDLHFAVALGQLHPDASTFLDWVRRALSQRNDHDGVTLSTVHKVKGLEWPHVVVHDASGGVIPHRLSTDVEEERRVFHVAITRAKATLAVVADADDPSLFLHELSEPGAPSPATTATRRSGAGEAGARPTRDGVAAAEDLRFVWGSYDCVVTAVGESGVTVSIGTSSTTIPFGSAIAVDGRSTQLDPAAPAGRPSRARADTSGGPVDEGIFAALKAWRLERSRTDGVPAYVVADNKTLEAISAAMPTDEHSLLAVAGIGPAKLELYGDEILAVLDQLRG